MGIKLTKQDKQNIREIREQLPSMVSVGISRSRDGGFTAEVSTFPGCYTEAESFMELVDMVNDAVRTYFEIPRKYYSYMPNYVPPLKTAQEFGAFPVIRSEKTVKLQLVGREKSRS